MNIMSILADNDDQELDQVFILTLRSIQETHTHTH